MPKPTRKTSAVFLTLCCLAFFTVTIATSGNDDEPLELERYPIQRDESIVIPVEIFGEKHPFALHLGSSVMMLDSRFQDRLTPEAVATELGINSETPRKIGSFTAPEIRVAGQVFQSKRPAISFDFSGVREVDCTDSQGMLGIDFVLSNVLRINFDEGFVAIQRTPTLLPAHVERLYLKLHGIPQILVHVSDSGFKTFQVDYGSFDIELENKLFNDLLARKRIAQTSSKEITAADGNQLHYGILDRLAIGLYQFHNVPVTSGPQNMVCRSMLQRFDTEFDFPNRRIFLRPGKLFNSPFQRNLAGVYLRRSNGTTIISLIAEGSIADKATLRKGDAILRINGKPASKFSVSKIQALFREPGIELNLTLEREGQMIERSLQLALQEDPKPFPEEDAVSHAEFDN